MTDQPRESTEKRGAHHEFATSLQRAAKQSPIWLLHGDQFCRAASKPSTHASSDLIEAVAHPEVPVHLRRIGIWVIIGRKIKHSAVAQHIIV